MNNLMATRKLTDQAINYGSGLVKLQIIPDHQVACSCLHPDYPL